MYGRFYVDPMMYELATDMWIDQNIPGGLDSPLGQMLDNMWGGNPNPTIGQRMYPYVGGGWYNGYGGFYGYPYAGVY